MNSSTRSVSRHSLLTIARKAGITNMSGSAVEKLREILEEKLEEYTTKLAIYKQGRTVTRKMVNQFLESEKVLVLADQELE